MVGFELYTFLLCLITFLLLVGFFAFLIGYIFKLTIRLIDMGSEDDSIRREFSVERKRRAWFAQADRVVSLILCVVLLLAFGFALFVTVREKGGSVSDVPVLRVVTSGSMREKHESNRYLFENALDDQIKTHDLIVTHPLPPVEEIKLYDILVYESNDTLIIHRVIEIEPPNRYHPDEPMFRLQGDANAYADPILVSYDQLRGIYRGQRVPIVGSFISFLHSPPGWLCILLVIFTAFALPYMQRKLMEEREGRYYHLLFLEDRRAREAAMKKRQETAHLSPPPGLE